jgi:phosphatidylinositol alpha 1,6-mannosyltransferase
MKVSIVTESFLPQTNGVVHSVLRVLDHLAERGIEAQVIAPDAPVGQSQPTRIGDTRVIGLPSWSFPGYPDVRVAGGRTEPLEHLLRAFRPDVVHLASPYVLGWRGVRAANELDIPSVAVYQTDVPSFGARYGFPWAHKLLSTRVRDIHSAATLTLAPSTSSLDALAELGVDRVKLWRRGVDSERFDPRLRDHALRERLAPNGEKLVGFVGRLAREKQVQDLAALNLLPGVSACCRMLTSPACCMATSSRSRWPAWTFSSTLASPRRSARSSRKASPVASRSWRCEPAGPSTWSTTPAPAGCTNRVTWPAWPTTCAT